jgi:hypothetical protein
MAYYNNLDTFTKEKLDRYLKRAKAAVKDKHKELEETLLEGYDLHEKSCFDAIDRLSTQIVELEAEIDNR